MGTSTLPTNLPTDHKKIVVQGYAQWNSEWPLIFVSVMHEDGTRVRNLDIESFKVGRMGHGSHWVEVPISGFNNNGWAHGFYSLELSFNTEGLSWNFNPDNIFTVEAFKTELEGLHRIAYRGQCLAAMQTKELP